MNFIKAVDLRKEEKRMSNYDFSKALSPERFQDFARDILQVREKNVMESFRKTKDGGIDMRMKKDGKIVIGQAKRYSDKDNLMKDLRNSEVEKVKKINPDRYILITSIDYDNKTKAEIMELFKGYIQEEKDIIGNTDLNNFLSLRGYEKIEENYPELWFNSSRVFEFILEKTVHRKIYNVSKEEFRKIQENEKTYIENEIYDKAKQMLENYNCLLITGEAGIGKTSLARHICYGRVKNGYKFVYAYDVDDIWDNYTEANQIFFLDDFWGSIFKERYDKTEEKKFQDVIETIQKSENKKLVLTSREYIIEKGFKDHPRIGNCLDSSKMVLKLKNYTDTYKAKIFLKHLQESDLNLEDIYPLIGSCEKFIHHPMYNPRLIAEFIQRASRQVRIEENYNCYEQLKNYLDYPEKFIKDVFEEQTEVGKLLLVLLFLRNWGTELQDLKSQYFEYLEVDPQIGKKEDFVMAMKQLSNDLIRVQEDRNFKMYYERQEATADIPIIVEFLNPSIKDFIYQYFTENLDKYVQNIIDSTTCLNTLMFLGSTYAFQKKGIDAYSIQIKEIQDEIVNKIIRDYDKLEYRYRKDIMNSQLLGDEKSEMKELEKILQIYKNNPNQLLGEFLEDKINLLLRQILAGKRELTYVDRLYFTDMLQEIRESGIHEPLEEKKLIEIYYNAIQYSEEIKYMEDDFKKVFPEEIEKFMKDHEQEIKYKLPKMVMQDAIYYAKMGYDSELANLIDVDYPELLKKYHFKASKRYENNLRYIAKHLYENFEFVYDKEKKMRIEQQRLEFKEMIEEEKCKIIKKFE